MKKSALYVLWILLLLAMLAAGVYAMYEGIEAAGLEKAALGALRA